MNFISTFDELNKLYESDQQPKPNKKLAEYYDEEAPLGRGERYPEARVKPWTNNAPQWWKDQGGTEASWKQAQRDDRAMNNHRNAWESLDDESAGSEELAEAAEDEIPTEEAPVEEPAVEDEPRQVICECDKCGALMIKDEADIVVDEETDLVNVEDECQFCEEANGYKIIGVVAPYEAIEVTTEEEGDSINETLAGDNGSDPQEAPEKDDGAPEKDEGAPVKEDLADLYRKTFDKPASTKTQQAWEDELNGEMGEISDKRRKHLEKKFAQQRDWEERHPDLVEEVEPEKIYADKLGNRASDWNRYRTQAFKDDRLPYPELKLGLFVLAPGMPIEEASKRIKTLSDKQILIYANQVRGIGGLYNAGAEKRYKTQRANDIRDGIISVVRDALEETVRDAFHAGRIPERFSERLSMKIRNFCGVDPKTKEYDPERLWKREIERGEETEIVSAF